MKLDVSCVLQGEIEFPVYFISPLAGAFNVNLFSTFCPVSNEVLMQGEKWNVNDNNKHLVQASSLFIVLAIIIFTLPVHTQDT